MTRRATFRDAARRDIIRFISFLAATPDTANEAVRRIEDRVARLTRFPFTGRPLRGTPLREAIVRHGRTRYVIRYKVTDHTVQIVRIWHGKEDR